MGILKKIVKSNKHLFYLALKLKESKLQPSSEMLDNNELELYNELMTNGVAVIPNFYSEEECQQMREEVDRLSAEKAIDYANDKRIYGIQKLSDIFKEGHHDNKMFRKIGEAYVGDELILQSTMAAKIVPDAKEEFGSGGSWHRDSFSRQFKAIAYLDDVDIDNGPFMYIKGSHTMDSIKKVIDELGDHTPGDYRYTNDEIEKIQTILGKEITYFTAPKGTLVLADIRGLHTGMPIKSKHRYTVFNYYIAKSFYQPDNLVEKLG